MGCNRWRLVKLSPVVRLEWIPGGVVFSATFVESEPFYHDIEEVCGVKLPQFITLFLVVNLFCPCVVEEVGQCFVL